jgi:hypothetical protein
MAQALEAATDLATDRCRRLTALAINRNLPVRPKRDYFHRVVQPPTPLGDELLDAALVKFEALGVYLSLVPRNHQSELESKLRETAELPEVLAFTRSAEWYSGDIGINIQRFLRDTTIPDRIELAHANELVWLDKAWYSLKTEIGKQEGAHAWSAMMGLPPSALEYVIDWAANAPGRAKGTYTITDEHGRIERGRFNQRIRDAGIFREEPHTLDQETLSRWLLPEELAGLTDGIDNQVLSTAIWDAVNICREGNAAIQLSMTLARTVEGDLKFCFVHSIVCAPSAAKKLFRAGWPFPHMTALDDEVADAILTQAGASMGSGLCQLHSREKPTRKLLT